MLYPIIRRVRRPLLPPQSLQTATPPDGCLRTATPPSAGLQQSQIVEQSGDVPAVVVPAVAEVVMNVLVTTAELAPPPVEQQSSTSAAEAKQPQPPAPVPAELPLTSAPLSEPKPVTTRKSKRAKATEEKSRKTVEPGAQA